MLDKGTIHIPAGTEQDRVGFHNTTQNGVRCKTYELLISGTFHLIYLDCSWLQITKTTESETMGKGELLYIYDIYNIHYIDNFK